MEALTRLTCFPQIGGLLRQLPPKLIDIGGAEIRPVEPIACGSAQRDESRARLRGATFTCGSDRARVLDLYEDYVREVEEAMAVEPIVLSVSDPSFEHLTAGQLLDTTMDKVGSRRALRARCTTSESPPHRAPRVCPEPRDACGCRATQLPDSIAVDSNGDGKVDRIVKLSPSSRKNVCA
eukprot:6335296-Prymnesium_polylepis.1